VWSPGAQDDVLGLIEHARHLIELEDEEMAYTPAIAALCADARQSGSGDPDHEASAIGHRSQTLIG
jgi:hypothetical protein